MVKYKTLKDETIKLTDSQISSLVDKHFQNMQDLLAKGAIAATDKIKDLLASSKTSSALKYLFKRELRRASDMDVNYESVNDKELKQLKKLGNIVASLSEKEREYLNNLLKVYGENIKGQDLKSVSVFEKIKLFFQRILRELKSSDSKVNASLFYWDLESREEQVNESDREITYPKAVLEEEVSGSSTLETILKEDEGRNVKLDYVGDVHKGTCENVNFSIIPQFAQEETLPEPQVAQIREKPAIPPKPQKVIDADNKIRGSQKTETPSYTSQPIVNLKSAGGKPKIAPKPIVKVDTKQYGTNVEKLKGKHERFIELASRSPIEQVVSSKGR